MVEYGKHVEFGTFKQRPNPFVRTVIYAKLGKIITEEINRYYGNWQIGLYKFFILEYCQETSVKTPRGTNGQYYKRKKRAS